MARLAELWMDTMESTNLAPSGSLALKTFGDAWEIQSES